MKISATKSKQKFKGYDINLKTPYTINPHYIYAVTLVNLTKSNLLELASFLISLARDLPDVLTPISTSWVDDWM